MKRAVVRCLRAWMLVAVASCLTGAAPGAVEDPARDEQRAGVDDGPSALRGRVLAPDGRPVAGATVRFRLYEPEARANTPDAPLRSVRSGTDGQFSSGEAKASRFDVRVTAEGYAFWTGRGVDPSQPLSVRLDRGVPLTGRVLAETTGDGVSGAVVRLDDAPAFDLADDEPEASTDDEGRYGFAHVPTGTVWVEARATGWATRSIRARVVAPPGSGGPAAVQDIWLPEGGRLSGQVVNSAGEAVPETRVLLGAVDGFIGAHRQRFRGLRAFTDDDGRFAFEGITAGTRYRVIAESDRYAVAVAGPFGIEAGTDLEDVTLVLQAGARMRWRLVDPDDQPVERVTIRLDPENRSTSAPAMRRSVLSTENGEIEIGEQGWLTASSLPAGRFTVRLEPVGWTVLRRNGVTLVEGETTDLGTIPVRPGAELSGRVVDTGGIAVAHAEVVSSWREFRGTLSRSTRTGSDGSFSLRGLPDHALDLTAIAAGFAERRILDVQPGGDPVIVKLKRKGGVHGRVELAAGGTPRWFSVQAVPSRFDQKPPVTGEGVDGAFEIGNLDPGRYDVLIRAPRNLRGRVEGIEVREGAVRDAGVILLESGRRLMGRVVREDTGAPCPGARVRLDRGAGPASWSDAPGDAAAIADPTGHFSIDGLEPIRYTLTLDHPEFAPVQRSVDIDPAAETTELELRLGPGGEIRGTVSDADGLPVEGANIYMFRGMRGFDRRMVTTRVDGSFRFPRLAPGTYLLMRGRTGAQGGLNNQIRTIDVKDGEITRVSFAD